MTQEEAQLQVADPPEEDRDERPGRWVEGAGSLLGLTLLGLGTAVKPMGMLVQFLMALSLLAMLWTLGRLLLQGVRAQLRLPAWRGASAQRPGYRSTAHVAGIGPAAQCARSGGEITRK